jgi:hypothetical protein
METKKVEEKKKGRGGHRPGSGRPKGGTNAVSINGLLDALDSKVPGKKYEDILMEDFLEARKNKDTQLTLKYHNLILNKVMTHVHKIEVIDSQEAIDAKQLAFTEALAKLTGLQKG